MLHQIIKSNSANSRGGCLESKQQLPSALAGKILGPALILVGMLSLASSGQCQAAEATTTLKIATPNLAGEVILDTTSYVSSEVEYSARNVENYALKISYAEDSNSLKLENGTAAVADTTTAHGALTKNTWGYAWGEVSDNNSDLTYKPIPAYGKAENIEQGTADISATTRKVVFAANLGSNMPSGHYQANILLTLVATPRLVTTAEWTLPDGTTKDSGIEYMQEIQSGFCANNSVIPINSTIVLKDKRDEATYKIIKWDDDRCWMYDNLALHTNSSVGMMLDSTYSDIESGNFTLPQSKTTGFNEGDNAAVNAYYGTTSPAGPTGYYTWCAATAGSAGACKDASGNLLSPTTAIDTGENAANSICPKNWKLPIGGGSSAAGSFWYLIYEKWDLPNNASGSIIMRNNKGFVYTGYMINSSTDSLNENYGGWWSRTAYSSSKANVLDIYDASMNRGYNMDRRFNGLAVRCVSQF